ncbi:hypothetical protein [Hydrogenophaga sp.]|uniref:hypothetical protein n=1 Tax=Hydrogenophaga sp. TaxID=1904254 RepID=UPI003D0D062C
MTPLHPSRLALGLVAATASLVLLSACEQRPSDMPAPSTGDLERERQNTNPAVPPSAPAMSTPPADAQPPASPPAVGSPGAPGGTSQ